MADFPINAVARRAQYVVGSSGQAGPYAFSFAILDDDDIAVYVGSTLKSKTTHYTVSRSLATGTGSITFVGGQEPVENDLVTLISDQALARTSDYTSGGDLQASSLNDDLDRLTIGQQQISETLDRSIQLPLFTPRDIASDGPLFFPYDATPANQGNKVIGFNTAGTALEAKTVNTNAYLTAPGSATDNALVRFDGTSGTAFQSGPVTVDDAGAIAGVTTLNGTTVSALLDTADIGVTVQGYDADTLKADTSDTLTAGFNSTLDDDGTQSSGTYTPAFATGTFKAIVNGGAFTLAPPSPASGEVIALDLLITNNSSAGTITTSGFTKVVGDSFTTTDGHDFACHILVFDKGGTEFSLLTVVALQ